MLNFFSSRSPAKATNPATTPGSISDLEIPGGPSPDRSKAVPAIDPTIPEDSPITHADDIVAVAPSDPQHDAKAAIAAEDGTSRAVTNEDAFLAPSATADVTREPSVAIGSANPPPRRAAAADFPEDIPETTGASEPTYASVPSAVEFENNPPAVHPPPEAVTMPEPVPAAAPESPELTRHTLTDAPVPISAQDQQPKGILRATSPVAAEKTHSRAASVASQSRNVRSTSPTPGSVTSKRARSIRNGRASNGDAPLSGSTFIDGAATAAPLEVDPALHERIESAEEELSPKEKAKLAKEEAKHGRRMSVIIKEEGKAEKQALDVATKELSELQKLQKIAIKDEAKAHTAHAKALADAHKAEMAFLAARAVHEKQQALLKAAEETLEASRAHARDTTDMLREKNEEVEHLRVTKQADDRERLLKIKELQGGEKHGIGRLFGM